MAIKEVTQEVKKIVNLPAVSVATKIISTVGVTGGVLAAIMTVIFSPSSLFELFLIPFRLFALLMTALGLKKRSTPWGVVYDSVTKQPLDPVYVVLKDLQGKEIYSAVTDIDGRYGFLAGPGIYTITAQKTNYAFPSQRLAHHLKDELYSNLYFGETIQIENTGGAITRNIPMDSLKFDWNEFAKRDKHLMIFYSKWDARLRKGFDVLFVVGFIIAMIAFWAAPYPYNSIILVVYLAVLLLRVLGLKPKSYGYVVDRITHAPLSFAIVRVIMPGSNIEIGRKITDQYGRYYCLVLPGKFYVTVERKNSDSSYSLAYTSSVIDFAKKGIVKEKFYV